MKDYLLTKCVQYLGKFIYLKNLIYPMPEALPPFDLSMFIEPIAEIVGPIVSGLSVILGGVFGIYLILLIIRAYYENRKVKILREIRNDLRELKASYDFSHKVTDLGVDESEDLPIKELVINSKTKKRKKKKK
jgi:hypothetical protein